MAMSFERKRQLGYRMMMAPALILMGAFIVFPAFYAFSLSLTNDALLGFAAKESSFVGLRNFSRLFSDPLFWNSLKVTLIFVIGSAVIGQFVLGFAAAVCLQREIKYKSIFNAIICLPNAVPEMVVGFLWISMYASGDYGTLNRIVAWFGVDPQQWLYTFPLFSIIIVNTWRGIAFSMILLTSGLASIPKDIYEAARVDGATDKQIFMRITLPMMMPTIFLYMFVSTVTTFAIFGLVYTLSRGGPANSTEILGIYIYNQSFTSFQLGYGAAVAVVSLVVSMLIGFLYVRALKVEV
ncbi:MAG: sugar ABC transporter permease [Paraglaciecola sp.]|uniref:carbohydrate ABC transporter permease n=1 Tax=Paraglaciecola sp. TaxID=1920173 RepID=UPI00273FB8CF|nr:sugar ABC transporter permease [Paraglaciecola sp.]MDP5033287.1 sugar ABC transporter permease [Paraglaciecola sp.]MDP5129780.1 sugar ABC transporter permease [Paraglaciecola sp.]